MSLDCVANCFSTAKLTQINVRPDLYAIIIYYSLRSQLRVSKEAFQIIESLDGTVDFSVQVKIERYETNEALTRFSELFHNNMTFDKITLIDVAYNSSLDCLEFCGDYIFGCSILINFAIPSI